VNKSSRGPARTSADFLFFIHQIFPANKLLVRAGPREEFITRRRPKA